jgi:hypothetical protein
MSIGDILVVAVGLVGGWTVVSLIFRKSAAGRLRKLGHGNWSDEDVRKRWAATLQVSPEAATDEIDTAFQRQFGALRQSFPAVMTDVEQQQFDRGSEILRRARDAAHEDVRISPISLSGKRSSDRDCR